MARKFKPPNWVSEWVLNCADHSEGSDMNSGGPFSSCVCILCVRRHAHLCNGEIYFHVFSWLFT